MYCQKCRTPIRPDDSLDNLNPASFKILVGKTPVPTSTRSRLMKTKTLLRNSPLSRHKHRRLWPRDNATITIRMSPRTQDRLSINGRYRLRIRAHRK